MGMGAQSIHDPVGTTTFRRLTSKPLVVLEVQYRTPDELRRLGIVLVGDDAENDYPSPFDDPLGGYDKYRPTR